MQATRPLAGTMQFIESSLRSLPSFNYVEVVEKSSGKTDKTFYTISYYDIHADAATCHLSWSYRSQIQTAMGDYQWVVDLKSLSDFSAVAEDTTPDASDGETSKSVTPGVYNLFLHSATADIQKHTTIYRSDGSVRAPTKATNSKSAYFEFADLAFAQQLGTAIQRAGKLCGSGGATTQASEAAMAQMARAAAPAPATPPQAPAASAAPDPGPTLPVTLQFIADKLNALGPVRGITIGRSGVYMASTLSNVHGDPQTCRLSYHILVRQYFSDGRAMANDPSEGDRSVDLHGIAKFKVSPFGTEANPLYKLEVTNAEGKVPSSGYLEMDLGFHEESLASRVGKAFVHAGQLCGAPAPEPF